MDKFIQDLKKKNIHIIGITGSEGSSILNFLSKYGINNITGHDFINISELERNYKLWHKGISTQEKNVLFNRFLNDLKKITFYDKTDYLKNIEQADIIFVPQSWRLYEQNRILHEIKNNGTPFYSLTRLYLDFAPAKIIAVTGTVGKGSTCHIVSELLKQNNKNVYLAGNETWIVQSADKLKEMDKNDYLILEISHRQLMDGFTNPPDMVIFTNLHENHLDEISYKEYKNVKLSIIKAQRRNQISILNYDDLELRTFSNSLMSNVYFYSAKKIYMNIKGVQNIYNNLKNIKSPHYLDNILAASTLAILLKIQPKSVVEGIKKISGLPARVEFLKEISGIRIFDDIKSTSPWATIAALENISKKNTVLIMGGYTKNIDYKNFVSITKNKLKKIIVLNSELSSLFKKFFPDFKIIVMDSLEKAIVYAYKITKREDNILISPGASFFYTLFIRGKKSITKIITSLPPREQG